ncbi:hypothetical protein SO802_016631 [Lithocarpus litseifolius]|uniref:Uncharacterized protein n=1 Tax=Lithocarpus litseifolius TaxID=425828 RepID=A0AAW2CX29_9ROSI
MVHLATIPITGTGINPARSFGTAVIYNKAEAWDDHWIFWVGPFIGATIAALYHRFVMSAAFQALENGVYANDLVVSKHAVIGWLVFKNSLSTWDRLLQWDYNRGS